MGDDDPVARATNYATFFNERYDAVIGRGLASDKRVRDFEWEVFRAPVTVDPGVDENELVEGADGKDETAKLQLTWSTKLTEGGVPQRYYKRSQRKPLAGRQPTHTMWGWKGIDIKTAALDKATLKYAVGRCTPRKQFADEGGVRYRLPNIYHVLSQELNNINVQNYTFASQLGTIVHDMVPWIIYNDPLIIQTASRRRCQEAQGGKKQFQSLRLVNQEFACLNLARFLAAVLARTIRVKLRTAESGPAFGSCSFLSDVVLPAPCTVPCIFWDKDHQLKFSKKQRQYRPMTLIADMILKRGNTIYVFEFKTRMSPDKWSDPDTAAHMRQASLQALAVACAMSATSAVVVPVLARVHVPSDIGISLDKTMVDVTFGARIPTIRSAVARNILADVLYDNSYYTDSENNNNGDKGVPRIRVLGYARGKYSMITTSDNRASRESGQYDQLIKDLRRGEPAGADRDYQTEYKDTFFTWFK